MTLTINRASFANALSACARVAAIRSGIPVGQCVRMEAANGSLNLSATDFDHWLDLSIPCDGALEAICVHAGRLAEVMAAALADEVRIELADSRLEVRCGRGRRSLATISANDFPRPELQTETSLELDADRLREAIQFALPSAASSDDVTKRALAGVHLHTRDGILKAVCTDRFNLMLVDVAKVDAEIAATIGLKAAEFAAQLIPTGTVNVDISPRAIVFTWDGGRLRGPLLEDDFVPYERAISEQFETIASVEGKAFHQALKAVRPLGENDHMSRSKRLKLTLNGCGALSSSSQEGDAIEEFEVDWDGDGEFVIGIAASRLEKMLRSFGDSVLTLKFNGPRDPFVFEAAAKPDRLGVLFPMSI